MKSCSAAMAAVALGTSRHLRTTASAFGLPIEQIRRHRHFDAIVTGTSREPRVTIKNDKPGWGQQAGPTMVAVDPLAAGTGLVLVELSAGVLPAEAAMKSSRRNPAALSLPSPVTGVWRPFGCADFLRRQ